MGTSSSKYLQSDLSYRRQASNTKSIAEEDSDGVENDAKLKILILGPAASGKTTIFKQLQTIHTPINSHVYTPDQRREYTRLIQLQCIRDFVRLLSHCTSPRGRNNNNNANNDNTRRLLSDEVNATASQVLTALTTLLQQACARRNVNNNTQQSNHPDTDENATTTSNSTNTNTNTNNTNQRNTHNNNTTTTTTTTTNNNNNNNNNNNMRGSDAIVCDKDMDVVVDMLQSNKHLMDTMMAVWRTECVQRALDVVGRGLSGTDSTQQLLDRMDEILCGSYEATDCDILLCYSHTTSASQCSFALTNKCSVRLIDLGGHESQRQAWVEHFTNVDAIIYVVDMNEYDHNYTHRNTNHVRNSMVDAVRLFRQLCECEMFDTTSMILVMNKWDLFEEKIGKVNLNVCFPDFTGVCDASRAAAFISKKFSSQIRERTQSFVAHTTCALSTSDVKCVLSRVEDLTICQNVLAAGII